jgi:DNA-binding CsgD family transcriptional regulator
MFYHGETALPREASCRLEVHISGFMYQSAVRALCLLVLIQGLLVLIQDDPVHVRDLGQRGGPLGARMTVGAGHPAGRQRWAGDGEESRHPDLPDHGEVPDHSDLLDSPDLSDHRDVLDHEAFPGGPRLRLVDDLESARLLSEKDDTRSGGGTLEARVPSDLGAVVRREAYAGNWDEAERLAAQGCELAERSRNMRAISLMSAARALVHVYRGRLECGRRDAHRAVELSVAAGRPIYALFAAEALGLAELSVADPGAAHACLAPFAHALRTAGGEPALLRCTLDDVEALVRVGDLDAAATLLGPFEQRARRLGRGWAVAGSSRCRGLLLAASGDLAGAEAALEAAVAVHGQLSLPFECARSMLSAAEVHRRARHRGLAAQLLEQALEAFERLGSPLWAERVHGELGRLGRRTQLPSGIELTAGERQVALHVAEGLTNAQVASKLFLSVRTVESHLSRIYQKLGVSNRTQLSRKLATP